MALFKSSPEKTLQRDVDASISARDKLRARLADAEPAVIAATLAAQRLALAGADDDALDKAEGRVRAVTDRVTTLRNAIVEAEATVVSREAERDAAADAKLRRETAAECEKMASDLEAVAASFDTAISGLAAISERAATFIFEASGLREYAAASKMQVPSATEIIAAMLRAHGAAVQAGDAPATLRAPDAAVPPVKVPAAPTVQLFALRAVRWKDETGKQRLSGKFTDVFLPKSAAARALAVGACVEISDPLRRKHHGWSTEQPQADLAADLDAETDAPALAHATTAPTPFVRVDREPYMIKHREAAIR